MAIPRNLVVEKNAIDVFNKQSGRLPAKVGGEQDWAQIYKIAYPNELPDELKNTSAYSYYQAMGNKPTAPAAQPVPTDGRMPLQQLQQDVQTTKGQASEMIGSANPAMQVLQDALKAKTQSAQAGIGESELYKKAGVTGMPVLSQSLSQTGAELNDAKVFFQNTISKMAGQYKSMADQAKFNYDAAVDAYNVESGRLQKIADQAMAHKYELENLTKQHELQIDLERFKNEHPSVSEQLAVNAAGGTLENGKFVPEGKSGMRTDRHNNPTAFTTDIAKQAGLIEGKDYIRGDAFPDNPNMFTAKLLGDPIETTIRVLDNIGFYTQGGKQRWTHTAIPQFTWGMMSPEEKRNVVAKMYQAEGGSGELLNWKPGGAQAGGGQATNEYGVTLDQRFNSVLSGTKSVAERNDKKKEYQQYISSGNTAAAERLIRDMAVKSFSSEQQKNYDLAGKIIEDMGGENGVMTKINQLNNSEKFIKAGIIRSAIESTKPMINQSKDKEWVSLTAKIGASQGELINKMFGAALTPSEEKRALSYTIDTGLDSYSTMIEKVNNLRQLNQEVRNRLIMEAQGISTEERLGKQGGGQQQQTIASGVDLNAYMK